MVNFQKLKYFCVMVEEGGIHKAARRLGISQPPLSMALKELEQELGCELVFRSGRKWIITEAGQALYEEGQAILAQAHNLPSRISHAQGRLHGEVRAGFSTSCVGMFRHVLPSFSASYPDVRCHAKFEDSQRLAEIVRHRTVDFAVLYLPVDGDEFAIEPFKQQRLAAYFSPLLPAPPKNELSLAKVCNYPLILPRRWRGGGIYDMFDQAVQAARLSPRVICLTQSPYILRDLLEDLPAVAILPRLNPQDIRAGEPEARNIRELSHPLYPALITLKNTYIPKAAQKLMCLLRQRYGKD